MPPPTAHDGKCDQEKRDSNAADDVHWGLLRGSSVCECRTVADGDETWNITTGDHSDPEWREAAQHVLDALASRVGGGDAYAAEYEDIARWVAADHNLERGLSRLWNLLDAALWLESATLRIWVRQRDDVPDDEDVPTEELTRLLHLLAEYQMEDHGPEGHGGSVQTSFDD